MTRLIAQLLKDDEPVHTFELTCDGSVAPEIAFDAAAFDIWFIQQRTPGKWPTDWDELAINFEGDIQAVGRRSYENWASNQIPIQ